MNSGWPGTHSFEPLAVFEMRNTLAPACRYERDSGDAADEGDDDGDGEGGQEASHGTSRSTFSWKASIRHVPPSFTNVSVPVRAIFTGAAAGLGGA